MTERKAKRVYDASDAPTIQHFLTDFTTPICGIMSHVNSGKTSAMCVKTQLTSANQHPDVDGVRRTSHLFIRGSHNDIVRTILRSFEQWIDPKLVNIRRTAPVSGQLQMQPLGDMNSKFPLHMYREGRQYPYRIGCVWNPKTEEFEGGQDASGAPIGDFFPKGTYVDAIFDFVPLDNPEWEASLLGTEYTGANFDEPDSMSNIAEVLGKMPTRIGRYPPADVAPITCSQINMAFNPPARGSFTQKFFNPADPDYGPGRKLYRIQPPLLMAPDPSEPGNFQKAKFVRNPDAEGVRYAGKGFKHWEDIVDANRHDPDKIRRDVLGEWTQGTGGALIHPSFSVDRHTVPHIDKQRSLILFCSCDWGLSGSALFVQYDGVTLKCLEELVPVNQMSHEFVKQRVIPHLNTEYRGFEVIVTGDPSGRYRRDVGDGPFNIFSEAGYLVEDDTPMDPEERWSAVNFLLKMDKGILISEECQWLIEGFTGRYTFKKQRNGVTVRQADKTKQHSAFQDALQAVATLVIGGYENASSKATADRYSRGETMSDEDEEFLWV